MSFDLVKEFNTTFEVVMRDSGAVRVPAARLRFRLIKEEFKELLDAFEDCDIVEVADALGDIEYVVVGAAQVFGVADKVKNQYLDLMETYDGDIDDVNPLLTVEGHQFMLSDLRNDILTNRVEAVVEILGTILFLVSKTAVYFSIDLPDVVAAIHTSNMTKLDEFGKPLFRESDRKVQKGPNYKTPTADIEALLFGTTNAEVR